MANEEHLAILKQGVKVWNQWRNSNRIIKPNLVGAELAGAKLRMADLSGADLRGADLIGADFIGANLSGSNLNTARLTMTHLDWANLRNANLIGADLLEANLMATDFTLANLAGADFSEARFGSTALGCIDLSQVKGLETAKHIEPSYIDIQTIYRSHGNISEVFLRGAGVPDNFIAYMKSLTGQAFDFYSCFISHSSKDEEFAARLYADLQSNGVRCWYAPEDLKIGEPFLLGIDHGIRLHDKLLLVLSEHSVNSGWVQHEVLSALAKEQGKEPWVLFPIRLDNAVMETTIPWATMIRQSRHIGDFTHWKEHDSYKKAFDKLLQNLKGKS